jgi:hypothetical protein
MNCWIIYNLLWPIYESHSQSFYHHLKSVQIMIEKKMSKLRIKIVKYWTISFFLFFITNDFSINLALKYCSVIRTRAHQGGNVNNDPHDYVNSLHAFYVRALELNSTNVCKIIVKLFYLPLSSPYHVKLQVGPLPVYVYIRCCQCVRGLFNIVLYKCKLSRYSSAAVWHESTRTYEIKCILYRCVSLGYAFGEYI